MITITHESLAEFIKNAFVRGEKPPEQFPEQNEKVCPDCARRYPGDRSVCLSEGTVLVLPMQLLAQPQVLLDALRNSELAERFVARSYLGQGLLCNVFEGLSVETVESVAIKVLRHELADDKKTNARFVVEAQMWQALKHRNIISVIETGLIPELIARGISEWYIPWGKNFVHDRPYIVTEHLKGINLKTVLQGYGSLGPELTMRIAVNVLDALHCAHKHEIVHRDLKPSNIFLVPDEEGRIDVKVSDFGLAARMFRQTEWTPQTTKTGSVYGDPSYLSPEYLIEQKTSARSDIYALGCIMYECISGKSPFAGQHEFHTMIRHVKDMPTALPTQLKVPDKMEKAIFKAIDKDPSKRFESAKHMHEHLGSLLTGVIARGS